MKQVLLFFLFCVFSIGVNFAQNNSTYNWVYINATAPHPFSNMNMDSVDSGNLRFFYALNATDISNPETYDDLQCLEIGSKLSKYFSNYVYKNDSLATDWKKKNPNVQDKKIPRQFGVKGKFKGWTEYIYSEYFKDFQKNELTEYARMPFGLDKYDAQYSESIPVQNWVISDETLTVAGYLCQKAICKFRGREYTAWFTTDIPINNGPWKFGGLPGLILKVYDKDKLFTYECVRIENHKQKFSIEKNKVFERYKKTDREKLWKTKKDAQENYQKLLSAITGRSFLSFSSADPTYREAQAPYNPLELE